MPPLLQMDSGTDPGEGVTRAKLWCPIQDSVIRPDGSRCELEMGRSDRPTGCPGCGREVTTTSEFGGPGPLPPRDGVVVFSRRSPVSWGGEYAPPHEHGYSTSPSVPARRRLKGEGPCSNCRFWEQEVASGRWQPPADAASAPEVHEIFFHVSSTFTGWAAGRHACTHSTLPPAPLTPQNRRVRFAPPPRSWRFSIALSASL